MLSENGGVTRPKSEEYGSCLFYGICDGSSDLRLVWRENLEVYGPNFLAIGEDPNEDHIVMDLHSGRVVTRDGKESPSVIDFLRENAQQIPYTGSVSELIQNSELEELEQLIKNQGLSVNSEAKGGYSLIQYAVLLAKEDVAKKLIELGADVSGCLHILLRHGHRHMGWVRLLVDNGASIDERDANGIRVRDINSIWVHHIENYINSKSQS